MSHTNDTPPSFHRIVPDGDTMERSVCTRCGFVDYVNPKVVVGSVATDIQGKILLCRRAIEPRKGWWTLPAGYLECGESVEDGARREAREEAGADLRIARVLAVYSINRISQVQIMFEASLLNPESIAPGPESLELAMVAFEDIPWSELAFPSVAWALRDWRETAATGDLRPRSNPVDGL